MTSVWCRKLVPAASVPPVLRPPVGFQVVAVVMVLRIHTSRLDVDLLWTLGSHILEEHPVGGAKPDGRVGAVAHDPLEVDAVAIDQPDS
jgi:hypothetical protein